jgi:hypothetical protein
MGHPRFLRAPQAAFAAACGALCICLALLGLSCANQVPEQLVLVPANRHKNLYPLYLGGQLVLTSECDGLPCLLSIDPASGARHWAWIDRRQELEGAYYNLSPYASGGYLAIPFPNSLKIFDMAAGGLKHDIPFAGTVAPHLTGEGGQVFAASQIGGRAELSSVDLTTGERAVLCTLSYAAAQAFICLPPIRERPGSGAFLHSILAYDRGRDARSFILRQPADGREADSLLAYPENPLGYGIARLPLLDTQAAASYWPLSDGLLRLGHQRFQIDWQRSLSAGILSSNIVLLDTMLIYPSDRSVFYFIDGQTGKLLDSLPAMPATPGRIFTSGEALFFVGGADGHLYRWQNVGRDKPQAFQHPGRGKSVGAAFRRQMYAGQGLLVLLDGTHWIVADEKALLDWLASGGG